MSSPRMMACPTRDHEEGTRLFLAVVYSSGSTTECAALTPDQQVTLGRSSSSVVHLTSPKVSRQHGEFTFKGDSWTYYDCNSRNGTYAGGKHPIHQVQLHPGTETCLTIGDHKVAAIVVRTTTSRVEAEAALAAAFRQLKEKYKL